MRVHLNASNTPARRRGVILVLTAILLVALLSFVALAVDIGVIATARAQLKTVADSAALAGARQLASDRRISTTITDLTPEMTAARSYAIAAGNANSVLGQAAQLTSSNIVIGYKNVPPGNPAPADAPDADVHTNVPSTQYNSVQVTASVTVPALFSAAFRATGSTVSVTSTATVELDQIKGFKSINNLNAGILPFSIDLATYNSMKSGSGNDSFAFNSSAYNPPNSNGVTSGSDGITEGSILPVPADTLSGLVDYGAGNGQSTVTSEIVNGLSPQTLSNYPNGTISAPNQFSDIPGNYLRSNSLDSSLDQIIGKVVAVPVWNTITENGQYNVVSFASVRVVGYNLTGNPSNRHVYIQPAINDDPTAIPDTSSPSSWSGGGVIFLHLSR